MKGSGGDGDGDGDGDGGLLPSYSYLVQLAAFGVV